MYRNDIRQPGVTQAFTITSSTSVALTIAGADGQCIYLTQVRRWFVGAAQGATQQLRIFDGAATNEIFRASDTTALGYNFFNPIRISEGNSLIVTTSLDVNTKSAAISLLYYFDDR